ncbi:MAG TPA: hypothetical protein VFI46_05905, partial [Jiangellaceae bacterium]|nr:hypothetical protein [Jiangellaceae bacterium]
MAGRRSAQGRDDLGVLAVSYVLVAQRCGRGGVPDAGHQGAQARAAGCRRYAAGDRILALAPHHPEAVVTSQRGTITAVDDHGLTARMDNGRTVRL